MALFSGITSLISKLRREPGVNADVDWNEIENQLIQSDLGPKLSVDLVELLKKNSKVSLEEGFLELLGHERETNLVRNQSPNVILIVGVNGVGKTTTVGKLAHYLVATGNKVVIGAADTFRAAATGQISTWAVNAGATLVSGKDGADPAAIAFDAVAKGFEIGADFVLIDTAPVGLVSDSIPIVRQADINLFVIRSGVSRFTAATIPERLSREYHLNNVVIVLNAFSDDALYSRYYSSNYAGNYYNNYYYSDYSGYYGSGYFEDDIPKWYEFGKKMNIKKNRNKD